MSEGDSQLTLNIVSKNSALICLLAWALSQVFDVCALEEKSSSFEIISRGYSPTLETSKQNVRLGLRPIPPSILEKVSARGVHIKVVPVQDDGDGRMDVNWAGLAGKTEILLTENCRGQDVRQSMIGTVKHEMGHELDFASNNPSQSEEFNAALARDRARMPPSIVQKRQIWSNSPTKNRELFANFVAVNCTASCLYSQEDSDEMKYCPETENYVLSLFPDLAYIRRKEDYEARCVATLRDRGPINPDVWIGYAQQYKDKGDLNSALTAYSAALSVDPKRISALKGRSEIYRRLGKDLESAVDNESYMRFRSKNEGFTELPVVASSKDAPQLWKYSMESPSGLSWTLPNFNDSAWKTGEGGFGQSSPYCKLRTHWDTYDIVLRRVITVPRQGISDVQISALHVNDMQVYFNGVLACSSPDWFQKYTQHMINADARRQLVPGSKMLIAVHCHNRDSKAHCLDLGLSRFTDD